MTIDKSMIKRLVTQTFPNGGDKYFDYEEEFDALCRAIEAAAQAEKQEPYKRGMTLQECADAEYKQEPVAWMVDTSYDRLIFQNAEQAEHFASKWDIAVVPLYTRPQPDLTAEVERLEWENKGIAEWRDIAISRQQRIAELEAAAREARDALSSCGVSETDGSDYYNRHQVSEAIAKLDAVLGDAALRGDSGLIAGVPLESTVMQKEDK